MSVVKTSRNALPVLIPVVVAIVDQLIKHLVLLNLEPGVPVPVIGTWFRLLLLFNSGAAFSLGSGITWVFTILQLLCVAAAVIYGRKLPDLWSMIAIGLIAGGALGNVIDRLFRAPAFFVGHVVDYISIGNFAVFNIADAAITCGVALLIAHLFVAPDKEEA